MDSSRRTFLKIAGVAAVTGWGARPVLDAFAASTGHGGASELIAKKADEALIGKNWGMVVDTTQIESISDLEPAFEACHKIHNVPELKEKRHKIMWIWDDEFEHVFPGQESPFMVERLHGTPLPVLCNHCGNPPCVRACPTKATFQRESDGIVLMDFHRCIGCRFCMAACPFGARSFNFRDPRPFIEELNREFPTRAKGVVEKCNFCAERLAVGKMPACVEASNGILTFGDLDDPESEVRELLREHFTIRRRQELGTEPSVYYIV